MFALYVRQSYLRERTCVFHASTPDKYDQNTSRNFVRCDAVFAEMLGQANILQNLKSDTRTHCSWRSMAAAVCGTEAAGRSSGGKGGQLWSLPASSQSIGFRLLAIRATSKGCGAGGCKPLVCARNKL